jgi:hypothetical protein
MLTSINPLGERARGNRWGVTATAYVLGSLAGGGLVGTVAGSFGFAVSRLVRPDRLALALLVAAPSLTAAVFDLGVLPVGLPTVHRQVSEDWLNRYRGWVYGVGFGFQLGAGVVTIVTTAAVYLAVALGVVGGLAAGGFTSAALIGATVGVVFGISRAVPVLLLGQVQSPAQLRATHRCMVERADLARGVTVVGLGGVAAAACGWLLR